MSDSDIYEAADSLSSDEYSDEDDDDNDLMNVAISSQNTTKNVSNSTPIVSKQPPQVRRQNMVKLLLKRKRLSNMYKKRSIKWLNGRTKREKIRLFLKNQQITKKKTDFMKAYTHTHVNQIEKQDVNVSNYDQRNSNVEHFERKNENVQQRQTYLEPRLERNNEHVQQRQTYLEPRLERNNEHVQTNLKTENFPWKTENRQHFEQSLPNVEYFDRKNINVQNMEHRNSNVEHYAREMSNLQHIEQRNTNKTPEPIELDDTDVEESPQKEIEEVKVETPKIIKNIVEIKHELAEPATEKVPEIVAPVIYQKDLPDINIIKNPTVSSTPQPMTASNIPTRATNCNKRPRSPSPILQTTEPCDSSQSKRQPNTIEDDISDSTLFYRRINELFPKYNEIVGNYVKNTNRTINALDDNASRILIELRTLNDMLQSKEDEWNRLLHLKLIKEEILTRLVRTKTILDLKEKHATSINNYNLLELKELDAYLSNPQHSQTVNKSFTSAAHQLIDKRANMRPVDLEREKNNINQYQSVLFSSDIYRQNEKSNIDSMTAPKPMTSNYMSNPNTVTNDHQIRKTNQYLATNSSKPAAIGRQGPFRDVKSIIEDFRQKNPDILPRVGKRVKNDCYTGGGIKYPSKAPYQIDHDFQTQHLNDEFMNNGNSNESNNGHNISRLEKLLNNPKLRNNVVQAMQNKSYPHHSSQDYHYNKGRRDSIYSLRNDGIANEVSITPIINNRRKQLHQNPLYAQTNLRSTINSNHSNNSLPNASNYRNQMVNGMGPENDYIEIDFPSCQECKSHEARFVCAGCGSQWYCSRSCQINAWDKHSEECNE